MPNLVIFGLRRDTRCPGGFSTAARRTASFGIGGGREELIKGNEKSEAKCALVCSCDMVEAGSNLAVVCRSLGARGVGSLEFSRSQTSAKIWPDAWTDGAFRGHHVRKKKVRTRVTYPTALQRLTVLDSMAHLYTRIPPRKALIIVGDMATS
jgi:hypothetical protein